MFDARCSYESVRRGGLFLIVLLMVTKAFAGQVHKIGNDLYAYISDNDSSANSTFLITTKGILVVDTGLNEQEGSNLLAEIRKISAQPVRYIVNTHYHPDHRGGNSAVGPDATVISTVFTLSRKMAGAAANASTRERIGFTDKMALYLDGHTVEIYFPGPAHTLGDAVVYFPQERAIATGDLFLNGSCPAMDQGDLENWIAALDSILTLPVDAVVPGHFDLAGKEQLRHFRKYLAELRDQVSAMFRAHASLKQILGSLDLHEYRDLRQYPRYEATFADNATAYYHQLERRARRN